jgi:hypothetical protein
MLRSFAVVSLPVLMLTLGMLLRVGIPRGPEQTLKDASSYLLLLVLPIWCIGYLLIDPTGFHPVWLQYVLLVPVPAVIGYLAIMALEWRNGASPDDGKPNPM